METKKQKGFSITEVLLIIAMIGLLLWIVIINISTFSLKSQESTMFKQARLAVQEIESCLDKKRVMFCSGTTDIRETSANCKGDDTTDSQPQSGTAICGTISPRGWSEATWPDVEKNGYTYSEYAGSQAANNTFTFSMFRDVNMDGVPDGSKAICCSHNGCFKTDELDATFGNNCRTLSSIGNED